MFKSFTRELKVESRLKFEIIFQVTETKTFIYNSVDLIEVNRLNDEAPKSLRRRQQGFTISEITFS